MPSQRATNIASIAATVIAALSVALSQLPPVATWFEDASVTLLAPGQLQLRLSPHGPLLETQVTLLNDTSRTLIVRDMVLDIRPAPPGDGAGAGAEPPPNLRFDRAFLVQVTNPGFLPERRLEPLLDYALRPDQLISLQIAFAPSHPPELEMRRVEALLAYREQAESALEAYDFSFDDEEDATEIDRFAPEPALARALRALYAPMLAQLPTGPIEARLSVRSNLTSEPPATTSGRWQGALPDSAVAFQRRLLDRFDFLDRDLSRMVDGPVIASSIPLRDIED